MEGERKELEMSLSKILLVSEVTEHIMSFLSLNIRDTFVLRRVCRHWKTTIERYTYQTSVELLTCGSRMNDLLMLLPSVFQRLNRLHIHTLDEYQLKLGCLKTLPALRHLSLAFPNFQANVDALASLTALVSLDISARLLCNPTVFLEKLTNLQRLSLIGSDNNELPDWSKLSSAITYLDLHGCAPNISVICSEFPNLKHLDIGRRARWGFQEGATISLDPLFKLAQLEYLDMSNLTLRPWRPGTGLSSLTTLHKLNVQAVNIKEVPDFFDHVTRLENLTHLQIGTLTFPSLNSLRNLRVLNCGRHSSSFSPKPIDMYNIVELKKLEVLLLPNTHVCNAHAISELSNLTELDMQFISPSDPVIISTLVKLRTLDLSFSGWLYSDNQTVTTQIPLLTALLVLNLSGTATKDPLVQSLTSLQMLRVLDLARSCISAESVPALATMTYLEKLMVKDVVDFATFSRLPEILKNTEVSL